MNTLTLLLLGLVLIYAVGEIAKFLFYALVILLVAYCILVSFNGNITLHQIFTYIKELNIYTIKQKIIKFFRGE
jgi:MFS superfamily sulfate permease-like transporter